MVEKLNVFVLYGGRSVEHDVSCRSAAFVLKNLDTKKFNVSVVGVDQQGDWHPQKPMNLAELDTLKIDPAPARTIQGQSPRSLLAGLLGQSPVDWNRTVIFPTIHGAGGEDGTLQGLLDLAQVAYVGPDTVGSACGIDKLVAKHLAHDAGVPIVPFRVIDSDMELSEALLSEMASDLSFPIFVKPSRLGSSVGVSRASTLAELKDACQLALLYDRKALLEKSIDAREIECAVIAGADIQVSLPGEVRTDAGFYSYETKYVETEKAQIKVPADLSQQLVERAQSYAYKVFKALDLYGLSRVDFFLEESSDTLYFNEVNTIPGFTQYSQFPLLWQAMGLQPGQIIERLIDTALLRHSRQAELSRQVPISKLSSV